jgi:argonaute-like protein implicated in RNA metabolism and viral defense
MRNLYRLIAFTVALRVSKKLRFPCKAFCMANGKSSDEMFYRLINFLFHTVICGENRHRENPPRRIKIQNAVPEFTDHIISMMIYSLIKIGISFQ